MSGLVLLYNQIHYYHVPGLLKELWCPLYFFSIYTSDCRTTKDDRLLVKYADDTVLTGLVNSDNHIAYEEVIQSFVGWCTDNHLILNTEKTKEMIVDFRKVQNQSDHIVINDTLVERVKSFKYLGVVIESKMTWTENIDNVIKKLNPRM